MKKVKILGVVLGFAVFCAAPAFAEDMPAPIKRFGNGLVDVIKSPLQLFEQPKAEMEAADNVAVGLFKGILKAPVAMVEELGEGVFDMVSFPVEKGDEPTGSDAITRLGDGLKKIVTSPMALINTPKAEMEEGNQVLGFFKGLLLSPFALIQDLGHGLVETITFPLDVE